MKQRILSLLLALVVLAGVMPAMPASARDAELNAKAKRMVELINRERAAAGVAPVTANNSLLEQAADIRAKEISTKFSHTRPNGTEPFTVLGEVGLSYRTAGENIAYNTGYQDTVAQTMEGFMNSPGHRANILKSSYQEVGIGVYVSGKTYHWVQLFFTGTGGASPSPNPNPNPSPSPTPDPEPSPEPEVYPGTPFTDITKHWGRDSIKWAYQRGLVTGVTANRFYPDQNMDRGMLAVVLYRLAGKPIGHPLSGFSDVPATAYYAKAVAWAAAEGIVSGVGGNRFAPTQKVTREQLATMLYRYAKTKGTAAPTGEISRFPDGGRVSSFAREAVKWAVGQGILSGHSDGRLDPGGNATRAETVVMLQRFAAS